MIMWLVNHSVTTVMIIYNLLWIFVLMIGSCMEMEARFSNAKTNLGASWITGKVFHELIQQIRKKINGYL